VPPLELFVAGRVRGHGQDEPPIPLNSEAGGHQSSQREARYKLLARLTSGRRVCGQLDPSTPSRMPVIYLCGEPC
jgi:hypothetical protein